MEWGPREISPPISIIVPQSGLAVDCPPPAASDNGETNVADTQDCPDGLEFAVEYSLFFGLTDSSRAEITEEKWQDFLANVVTPRYSGGLTVLDAHSQWQSPTGDPHRERTRLRLTGVADSEGREAGPLGADGRNYVGMGSDPRWRRVPDRAGCLRRHSLAPAFPVQLGASQIDPRFGLGYCSSVSRDLCAPASQREIGYNPRLHLSADS